MAKLYTYEDFEKAAKDAGMYGSFSDPDLKIAKDNADAGMSILSYKKDYAAATDEAAKKKANQGAEAIRKQYGYTGGTDGSGYYLQGNGAGTWKPGDTVLQAQQMLQAQMAQKPGVYQSQWQAGLDEAMKKILNREKFEYDLNGDALYQQYKDQYTQQGKLAMMDTMGQAQAMTGGYGNSYAQSVGQQTYQGYLQQLNDKVPELYQLALNKYQMEGDALLNQYGLMADRENQDYGRHRDALSDWNAELSRLQQSYLDERNFDYGKYADDRSFRHQQEALDYQKERDKAADDLAREQLDYQKERDQLSDQRYQQEYDDNKANIDYERNYAMAMLKAQYGDYSGLRELGINIPEEEESTGGYYYYDGPGDDDPDDPGEGEQGSTAYTPMTDDREHNFNDVWSELKKNAANGSTQSENLTLLDLALKEGAVSNAQYDWLKERYASSRHY